MAKEYVYQLVSKEKGTENLTAKELSATSLVEDFLLPDEHKRTIRKELIGQPILKGYLGPMYNGMVKGNTVIRYETQEVYDALSSDY